MFEIIFDDKAIDFLNNLNSDLKKRIFNKIISTKEDPFRFFERLEGRTDFKLRVGTYRVIADINKEKNIIEITFIEHRKKVYKILNR